MGLDAKKPPQAVSWGFEELRQRTFRLSAFELASLLGPAPGRSDVTNLGFKDLQSVLKIIARQAPTANQDLRPVPADKISANGLSDSVKALLKAGMVRSTLVGEYFNQSSDPTIGDEVVQSFRSKYQELRGLHSDPDRIFVDLQIFAGGEEHGEASHQAAVLAVLAYLFEQCDIFERPSERNSDDSSN